MTREEKLQLQAAKRLYETSNADQRYVLESLFPELAESEDERIRKELIRFVRMEVEDEIVGNKWLAWLERQGENVSLPKFTFDDVLALQCCMETAKKVQEDKELYEQLQSLHDRLYDAYWLEKQEEKPIGIRSRHATGKLTEIIKDIEATDKVEPKFKPGDWITNGMCTWKIEFIEDGLYYQNDGDIECGGDIDSIDKEYHLWSIKDAKDGDVLADKYNNIGIFQKCEGICWHSYVYLGCDGELRGFSIGGSHEQIDTHPATKEQREQLEKAMTDAGYTFDFEKKKLNKIEQKPTDNDIKEALRTEYEKGRADAIAEMQKHAWSLDDVYMIKNICHAFEKGSSQYKWLKTLKQRIGG